MVPISRALAAALVDTIQRPGTEDGTYNGPTGVADGRAVGVYSLTQGGWASAVPREKGGEVFSWDTGRESSASYTLFESVNDRVRLERLSFEVAVGQAQVGDFTVSLILEVIRNGTNCYVGRDPITIGPGDAIDIVPWNDGSDPGWTGAKGLARAEGLALQPDDYLKVTLGAGGTVQGGPSVSLNDRVHYTTTEARQIPRV